MCPAKLAMILAIDDPWRPGLTGRVGVHGDSVGAAGAAQVTLWAGRLSGRVAQADVRSCDVGVGLVSRVVLVGRCT